MMREQDMKAIYADYAATTPLCEAAKDIFFEKLELFGNPSSSYRYGRQAKREIKNARKKIAKAIGALEEEIYFTAGGTEGNNWILKGTTIHYQVEKRHLITSGVEHPSVLESAKYLERQGFHVTYLPVDRQGSILPDALEEAIREDTFLISIMMVNNEVGTIQPVKDIEKIAKKYGVLLHTDAVQAVGHIPVNVETLGVDFLTLSGHKFGGPKGTGAVYIKKGSDIAPLLHGGVQEAGYRAGTENTLGILAMAAALARAEEVLEARDICTRKHANQIIAAILEIPGATLTGSKENRISGIASFVFDGIDGQRLIHLLDSKGICVSSGAACKSGLSDSSHVLAAMGYSHELAQSALRISLSHETTQEEVTRIAESVKKSLEELRGGNDGIY